MTTDVIFQRLTIEKALHTYWTFHFDFIRCNRGSQLHWTCAGHNAKGNGEIRHVAMTFQVWIGKIWIDVKFRCGTPKWSSLCDINQHNPIAKLVIILETRIYVCWLFGLLVSCVFPRFELFQIYYQAGKRRTCAKFIMFTEYMFVDLFYLFIYYCIVYTCIWIFEYQWYPK